jgi:hypothetical protein
VGTIKLKELYLDGALVGSGIVLKAGDATTVVSLATAKAVEI